MVKLLTPRQNFVLTHPQSQSLLENPSPHSQLTDNELKLWLTYIENEIGFILPASQNNWVKNTIERYLHQYEMDTTHFLVELRQNSQLYHQLIDDILIPRTQFFRHLPTFEFIEAYARHYHNHQQAVKQPLIAWSVGCSTGQEPMSTTLSLAKTLGRKADFRVFGSDFHQKSLEFARVGQYDMGQLNAIPTTYHRDIEQKILPTSQRAVFKLIPDLAEHVSFFSYNLVKPSLNLPLRQGSCQLIMCKNVLIYFRQFEQRDIVNRLIDYLAVDGVLLLGVGELPNLNNPRLKKLPYPQINGFCHIDSPIWLEQLHLAK